jgi:hypothetical protein
VNSGAWQDHCCCYSRPRQSHAARRPAPPRSCSFHSRVLLYGPARELVEVNGNTIVRISGLLLWMILCTWPQE